ncbi:MAG TPA: hypothetical protein VLK65_23890 [Vicinamibacteria bacterium]|nr:hypothetical protein [Vicinamibacteria bacterium]
MNGEHAHHWIHRSRLARIAGAAAALLVLSEALLHLGSLARGPVRFDVGPSTGDYLTGFTASEERPPLSFRWTGPRARIEMPLQSGPQDLRLRLRYARFLDSSANVRIFLGSRQAGSFRARSGRFRTETLDVRHPGGRCSLEIWTEDPDANALGIPIDWLILENASWQLPFSAIEPRSWPVGVFAASLVAGFSVGAAFAAGGIASVLLASFYAIDPFGMIHVTSKLALPALALTAMVAIGLRLARRDRSARWLVWIFLAGYALKGAGIFHPSYFYPDVRNHQRYIFAFAQAEGGIVERGIEAQKTVRTAYPRRVAGKDFVFPYSPVFFVPFAWLPRERPLVEEALKQVSLAAAALEVIAVYALALRVAGPGPGVLAALLAAFLPVTYSRLFLAMWPTVTGHLLDTIAIAAAASAAREPSRALGWIRFGALTFASFVIYVSSLFNLSAFAAFFGLGDRRARRPVWLTWGLAAVATILLLYATFATTFLREILPGLVTRGTGAPGVPLAERFSSALTRLELFYGYGFPPLALAGILVLRRCHRHDGYPVMLAYGLAFALLSSMRVLFGDLFKDLKEVLFVGPLVATTAGLALHRLAQGGRIRRVACACVTVGLIAFGCSRFSEYLSAYASLAGAD